MDLRIEKTLESLRRNKIEAEYYSDRLLAIENILSDISVDKSVGIGSSVTIDTLQLPRLLSERGNKVYFHWLEDTWEKMCEIKKLARNTDVYLSSTNAISQNGEIVNIDGQGNRVASMIYGHEKVLIICGSNKIVDNLESALRFVKDNAYKNARRLNLNTPCAVSGKCNNCNSPQRMCRVTTIIERQPLEANLKVIIINEELGL